MRESAAGEGAKTVPVRSLSLGMPVLVMVNKNVWGLIVRDGRPLGYVAEDGLAPVK